MRICQEREIEKSKWMNESMMNVKDKIKYTMDWIYTKPNTNECIQNQMYTKIVATPITD